VSLRVPLWAILEHAICQSESSGEIVATDWINTAGRIDPAAGSPSCLLMGWQATGTPWQPIDIRQWDDILRVIGFGIERAEVDMPVIAGKRAALQGHSWLVSGVTYMTRRCDDVSSRLTLGDLQLHTPHIREGFRV
jgi:hypothetical protein